MIEGTSIKVIDLELQRIYRNGIPQPITEELNALKLELSKGGNLYEIASDKKSWQGLHGSWGYTVVRNNCLISYLQLIVN